MVSTEVWGVLFLCVWMVVFMWWLASGLAARACAPGAAEFQPRAGAAAAVAGPAGELSGVSS